MLDEPSTNEMSLCDEDDCPFRFQCGPYEKEGRRFANFFRDAGRQIPVADREAIGRHVRTRRPHQPWVFVWLKSAPEMQSPAEYDDEKKWMVFDVERLFGFPSEKWITLAIAHECAHLYLYAFGEETHTAPQPEGKKERKEWDARREDAVRQVLGRWGFEVAEHEQMQKWGKNWDWGRAGGWPEEFSST
jgi:hypothetical protein